MNTATLLRVSTKMHKLTRGLEVLTTILRVLSLIGMLGGGLLFARQIFGKVYQD
ncbi:MAG: hypothetical protein LBN05_07275 [Oscillospiraceae bacterium]|jgi:hypothetical protein|nr:hypothetical protein [Oscillospiraceae bacterium]